MHSEYLLTIEVPETEVAAVATQMEEEMVMEEEIQADTEEVVDTVDNQVEVLAEAETACPT